MEQYKIKGMTCAACARSVERAVKKLEGTSEVNVNLATETLSYKSGKVKAQTIFEAVEKAGYKLVEQAEAEPVEGRNYNLIVAVAFTLPLFYLAMAPMVGLPIPSFLDHHHPLNNFIAQVILVLPVIVAGRGIYAKGFTTLKHLSPNMDSLIAIGTTSALIYSIFSLVVALPSMATASPSASHLEAASGGGSHLYFETVGVILALVLLGRHLEHGAKKRTAKAIKQLMQLQPEGANVLLSDGQVVFKPLNQIVVDDFIRVKPGERVALDGLVVEGNSEIDESMMTGESLPVEKKAGDQVVGGSINGSGTLVFKVTAVGGNTLLSRIITMVTQAQGSKAPIANLADQVAGIFVPTVFAIAVVASLTWFFIGGQSVAFSFTIFVAVLTIACPCALGLATPTSLMVAMGKGAKQGILIKNGEALETASSIDTIMFDKTGTLTTGKVTLTHTESLGNYSVEQLLFYASCLEQYSEHPLAKAFLQANTLALKEAKNFKAEVGHGISGEVDGHLVVVGNQFNKEILPPVLRETKSNSAIFIDGKLEGLFALTDTLKPTSLEAVSTLKALGIKVYMLSGDRKETAQIIAKQAGIDEVLGEMLPTDKSDTIKRLQAEGHKVAMVGDGVNDAAALALADLSIAMASGSDIAMESASVTLVKNDLRDVGKAIKLSKATLRNIKQNLFWAFGYNVVGIPIACGLLYLFGGPLLNPMLAALAMSFSSVSVVLNSLRLGWVRL